MKNVIQERLHELANQYDRTGRFLRQVYSTTISTEETGMSVDKAYEEIVKNLSAIHDQFGFVFTVQRYKDIFIVEVVD